MRFRERSRLRNTEARGEAASAGVDAAAGDPEALTQIIREGGCAQQRISSVDGTAFCWKKMPSRTSVATEEKSVPGFRASKVG